VTLLVDSYEAWCTGEGVPIVESPWVDLLTTETSYWQRADANAAFIHLEGRGDYTNIVLLEIEPAAESCWQRHLYDEVVYVIAGTGSTHVRIGDIDRTFEWGPQSLFSIPRNAEHRYFNLSGATPARLAIVTSLPIMVKLFRNVDFLFANEQEFNAELAHDAYEGAGRYAGMVGHHNVWETNIVPNLAQFTELRPYPQRGGGEGAGNIKFWLGDNTIGGHISEIPVGRYKKAHRHDAGVNIFAVNGAGYSLLWYEGDSDFERVEWRHGVVYAPGFGMFHQHFNVGEVPARYLALTLGGIRFPISKSRKDVFHLGYTSIKDGGNQIEYEDEDPRIRAMFEDELASSNT
jgi:quercetin dioxygenase-like cupin family protein